MPLRFFLSEKKKVLDYNFFYLIGRQWMLNHLLVVDYLKKKKKLPHPNPPPQFCARASKTKTKNGLCQNVFIGCNLLLIICSFILFIFVVFFCVHFCDFFLEGGVFCGCCLVTHTHTHIFFGLFLLWLVWTSSACKRFEKNKQNVSSLFDKKKSLTFACVCVAPRE